MGELLEFSSGNAKEQWSMLWREALGAQIKEERTQRGERMIDVPKRAGVSQQYLSEIERGRKDPSSEILHAISGALELEVSSLTRRTAERMESNSTKLKSQLLVA